MEDDQDKAIVIFGRDVRKIPCFRETFLYGTCTGVFSGLGTFLLTSRAHTAANIGFVTYLVVGSLFWVQCRIRYVSTFFNTNQLQDLGEDGNPLKAIGEVDAETLKKQLKEA